MNPHMPAGPPAPHYSRRQQEYHQYQQHMMPQSPTAYNPYAYQYPPQYYGQPMPPPYPMPRWAPPHQPAYTQYPMPPQMHHPHRSPMVVSSQPMAPQMSQMSQMPPPTQHVQYPPSQIPPPSPYASPHATSRVNSSAASLPVSSPREPPSASSTPAPVSRRSSSVVPPRPTTRLPFYPRLPWYSSKEAQEGFPKRAVRQRRRYHLTDVGSGVFLPSREDEENAAPQQMGEQESPRPGTSIDSVQTPSAVPAPDDVDENNIPSVSAQAPEHSSDTPKPLTNGEHKRSETRPVIPIIPALPHVSKQQPTVSSPSEQKASTEESTANARPDGATAEVKSPPVVKSVPKSWADLVRTKGAGAVGAPVVNGVASTNGTSPNRGNSMAEVIDHFDVSGQHKYAFLEPRGLVNTGNMCYMNSILQILISCIPFYDFMDQIGKRAAHSFKSETPIIDAFIMFMSEFKVIDSAASAEKLRLRLKDNELEQYGDHLVPEYVYSAINRLPRFSSMRRGHQQDAEEFLGFLLAGLHDECISVLRLSGSSAEHADVPTSPVSTSSQATDGWLEVGRKQKAAITRQAGDPSASSPITRIFGGALRSELRVPGLKNSVTLEPYQPLQLDIGAPNINNITDALKAITKPETLVGDFNSPRGPGTTATKQVFIDTLPPVLILHLKRFQYDSSGGTQKIWKRVGYPLEFDMPKEVLPPSKRGTLAVNGGAPRYRLTSVVYHHGKSAAGGHYTVDLLRQDRREWVRIDDTYIRRVRSEDVAEGGAEEDPKILAKALERHAQEAEVVAKKNNPYEGLDGGDGDHEDEGKAWSNVNGTDGKKRWAGIAAAAAAAATGGGSVSPSTAGKQTPSRREGVKDSKVAYILLYEKISP